MGRSRGAKNEKEKRWSKGRKEDLGLTLKLVVLRAAQDVISLTNGRGGSWDSGRETLSTKNGKGGVCPRKSGRIPCVLRGKGDGTLRPYSKENYILSSRGRH